MKLIVGLGNPGKEYRNTRHNAGWIISDALAKKEKWQESKKAHAFCLKEEMAGQDVIIIKPTTFMNNSGLAVAYAKKKHNLRPEDIIVIHDDMDLPLGEIKIQTDRGSAGHKGVESIIDCLGTKNFTRLRIGIATDAMKKQEASNYVLGRFTKAEQKNLAGAIAKAIEEIKKVIAVNNSVTI